MHRTTTHVASLLVLTGVFFVIATPLRAAGADEPGGPPPCSLRTVEGSYGFQCQGSALTPAGFEPVTFVGTVSGNGRGWFEGYGTFNSSAGSASTHVAGRGTVAPRCFGHVDYTINEILLPGGGTVTLPPVSFDFAVVDKGRELLGTGVASPPDVTGDLVPRLNCRLVRIR